MNNPNQTNDYSLIEVSDDFETLTLIDGSQWSIYPTDVIKVCTWIPMATIRVELVAPGSSWQYELMNVVRGVSVRATRKVKDIKKRRGKKN
jgi:hypothetical protein